MTFKKQKKKKCVFSHKEKAILKQSYFPMLAYLC